MTLDVGCGCYPLGEVNCDLYVKDIGHRTGQFGEAGGKINRAITPNFVLCDAQYLPFKNSCFDRVISRHVIEHVEKPDLLMFELIRVSKHVVEVFCPNIFDQASKKAYENGVHKSLFRCKWFVNFGKKYFEGVVIVENSRWRCIPNSYVCLLRLPFEIHALFIKR